MATGTPDHQFLISEFIWNFKNYLNGFEEPPAEFYHSITTVLSQELQRIVEPDVVVHPQRKQGSVRIALGGGAARLHSRNSVHSDH